MAGTFASLNTALSALRYNRVAMDVASGNIANVGTDGYVRRRVVAASVGQSLQPAMWSRSDGVGDGVKVAGVDRMADGLLDVRARREHGNQSYLDIRQSVLERFESGIGEPGDNGVAAAIADFRSAWHDLANNPGSEAARTQVIGRAGTLADAIRIQSRNVEAEAGDLRMRAIADVAEVNTVAADLATTSEPITPFAPARFSTSTVWPRLSESFCASVRPRMSTVPVGGQGTIILIGLAG